MADDDGLDDFFAKKDKKGKSKKNKFTTADFLEDGNAKTDQQKAEKPKKKKKPKEKSDASKTTGVNKSEDEEEWIEVNNEEVNYAGLKIKTLQIVDESEQDRDTQEQAEDEDGESPGSRSTQGPWAGAAQPAGDPAPAACEASQEPADAEEKSEEPVKKAAPAKYIPPSLRKAMMETANSPSAAPMRRGKPRVAPDIQSQMHFPSLGQTSSTVDRQKEKEFERENPKSRFETVKSGNRQLEDSSKRGLQLEIENKFDLLQDN